MVTKGQVIRYAVLPGIWPRLRRLVGSGFVTISLLLAMIFSAVRLLPQGHPYLNPENAGRFGIRHVIAQAASNLEFSRRNADQVFVFFVILSGIVILCIQFVLLFIAFFTEPVIAQTASNFRDVFENLNPEQDLAFGLLDRVFGVRGIFESCISQIGVTCTDIYGNAIFTPSLYPYPVHIALHQMLGFYSLGIGVIALMVILYQIVNIVGETAASGTPFGQRFNKTWAPVRIILFFALLAPLNVGGDKNAWLNGAQLITFYAAKWGSNVATNAWRGYNETLSTTYIGEAQQLIAAPQLPKFGQLMQFYTVMHTCKTAYARKMKDKDGKALEVKGYIINNLESREMLSTNFDEALKFVGYGTIYVRYGVIDKEENPTFAAGIRPLCGEIQLTIGDIKQPGTRFLLDVYFKMLQGFESMSAPESRGSLAQIITFYTGCLVDQQFKEKANICDPSGSSSDLKDFAFDLNSFMNSIYEDDIEEAFQKQVADGEYDIPPGLLNKGWAGAAIWYNTIAEMNGAMTSTILGLPSVYAYPEIMQQVEKSNKANARAIVNSERFNPGMIGRDKAVLTENHEEEMARVMYEAFRIFEDYNVDSTPFNRGTDNVVLDTINAMLGTSGLFSLRQNADIHPLAQLSSLGRGMVEQAIRNFGAAVGITIGGGLMGMFPEDKNAMTQLTDFFKVFATVGVLIGFILYYVLPFLPFIYFFFALGLWVKSIFEAIVAMPLWALAHLTIDGPGLSGQAASNGYFLIFEIFTRPILTFFGLIGSILIFSAMVQVLNDVFEIVVSNVAGSNPVNATADQIEYYRGTVDEFFYTLVYAAIVYMIGLSSFKLIDMVPDTIMRWMGVSVPTFQESDKNAAQTLVQSVYQGSQIQLGQLQGGQVAALLK